MKNELTINDVVIIAVIAAIFAWGALSGIDAIARVNNERMCASKTSLEQAQDRRCLEKL